MKNKTILARKLIGQYIVSFIVLAVVIIGIAFVSKLYLGSFVWHYDDPFYPLLNFISNHLTGVLLFCFICLSVMLTFFFLLKATRYLDQALLATRRLLDEPEKPITLNKNLYEFETEINQIRQESLTNSQAAKEADQKKNDLIVYLAHDLRTPLTSIIGYLTMLQESPELPVEYRSKYTGIALEKAYRLESLLGEFFEITRFNLSQLSLTKKSVDLSLMVEQFTSEFTPILAEKNLRWDLHIEKDLRLALDPEKFARVLDNIIKNAINYANPDSALKLTLQKQGTTAQLALENTGIALAKDKLDRIFEPFFRGDSARTTTTGGTGLGLPIAKQIVELHGGQMLAESRDNTFTLTLALPVGASAPAADGSGGTGAPSAPTADAHTEAAAGRQD